MAGESLLKRVRADSELAVIAAFAACGIFGIVPFAIYRFATGNPVAGIVDLAIVSGICLAWMSRADAALYEAKKQGRNQTVVHTKEVA